MTLLSQLYLSIFSLPLVEQNRELIASQGFSIESILRGIIGMVLFSFCSISI